MQNAKKSENLTNTQKYIIILVLVLVLLLSLPLLYPPFWGLLHPPKGPPYNFNSFRSTLAITVSCSKGLLSILDLHMLRGPEEMKYVRNKK